MFEIEPGSRKNTNKYSITSFGETANYIIYFLFLSRISVQMPQYDATIEFFRTHEFANNGGHRCPEAAATKFLSKQRTSNICDAMYRGGNVTFYRDL